MDRDVIDALVPRADRSGVFLDFDGTLSEIAPTPEEARAIPGSPEVLARLAERFRVVAVLSGRRVSEVEERLGRPPGVLLFGLYGLEAGSRPEEAVAPSTARAVEEILPRVLELAAGLRGMVVEPKGPNLAVHYRNSPDPEEARRSLLASLEPLARTVGLRLIEGKRVLELVPMAGSTKGDLLAREAASLEGILYAGDDLADLEAFAAIDRLAYGGIHGVKVAVRSAETPAELVQAADVIAEGPAGLLEILRALCA